MKALRASILSVVFAAPFVLLLSACGDNPQERQDTRQETRVEGRTEERMEERRD